MELIEIKAKFFDLQRAIEQKDTELKHLVELRQNLVAEIYALEEKEKNQHQEDVEQA